MAKSVKEKKKKPIELASFGGTKELGTTTMHDHKHDVATTEAQSERHIEDDPNEGREAIIRRFTFGMNIAAIKEAQPTKQDIFNSHLRGIEMALWRDGMKIMDSVEPRIMVDTEKLQYHVFVGARPAKGHLINQAPQSLKEIVHGI